MRPETEAAGTSPAAAVLTRGLTKTYGPFGALHGLDLTVPRGSVFALLGASGAGKTTTLKILLNLLPATGGTAELLGIDSTALGAAEFAQIGYVSENQALPARLQVRQFFDHLRPLYPRWDRQVEEELREGFLLPPRRRIGELSHGMRMKMALACALPFHPALLILDEPLSGLDALARDEIVEGLLRRADRMTVVVSSHELDEVERFASHLAFLHEGRLLFQGTLAALAEHARPLTGSASARLRDSFVALVRAARAPRTRGAAPGGR